MIFKSIFDAKILKSVEYSLSRCLNCLKYQEVKRGLIRLAIQVAVLEPDVLDD